MNSTSLPASWAKPLLGDTGAQPRVLPHAGQEWHLQRRCSMTPTQLALSFGLVLVLVGGIGLAFWWIGAPIVTAFAGLEVLLVAAGFAWHALHAADGERLCVQGQTLIVESRRGLRHTRVSLHLQWLRVKPAHRGGIDLTAGRRTMRVGLLVNEATNRRVANELSQTLAALRRAESVSE